MCGLQWLRHVAQWSFVSEPVLWRMGSIIVAHGLRSSGRHVGLP